MERYIGIDVHKNQSQICMFVGDQVVERRINTDRVVFGEMFGTMSRARILIEASTESEWVARCLEGLGHEVIVADPNFQPMYATRNRKIKTDKRDARALAEACRLGAYRKAHRVSDRQRHIRAQLSVREALVRSRSKYIVLAKSLLRGQGYRIESGTAEKFLMHLGKVTLTEQLQTEIVPLGEMIEQLNNKIKELDETLEEIGKSDENVMRLQTLPGVGPVTALGFTSAMDNVGRFQTAAQVSAYLGLVPRESSSGEKQHKGSITKAGHGRLRYLLVQAAWCVMRSRDPRVAGLKEWVNRVQARRGRHIATVALARRLARILFAMMRDEKQFESRTTKKSIQNEANSIAA